MSDPTSSSTKEVPGVHPPADQKRTDPSKKTTETKKSSKSTTALKQSAAPKLITAQHVQVYNMLQTMHDSKGYLDYAVDFDPEKTHGEAAAKRDSQDENVENIESGKPDKLEKKNKHKPPKHPLKGFSILMQESQKFLNEKFDMALTDESLKETATFATQLPDSDGLLPGNVPFSADVEGIRDRVTKYLDKLDQKSSQTPTKAKKDVTICSNTIDNEQAGDGVISKEGKTPKKKLQTPRQKAAAKKKLGKKVEDAADAMGGGGRGKKLKK